jgi:hypothetical protein
LAEHPAPPADAQLIPPVSVVTDPPLPVTETDNVEEDDVFCVKVAETLRAVVIATAHVGTVPLHTPPQPLKLHPLLGVAVNVTVGPPV